MGPKEPASFTVLQLKRLLRRIKENIPTSEISSKYSRTQKILDWKKVAFIPFSPEECQLKWTEMTVKMRKIRSLAELIDEAETAIDNPFKLKGQMIHPGAPTRPTNSHGLFYKEKQAEFKTKNPGLKQGRLVKIIMEAYNELPADVKATYVERSRLKNQQYRRTMLEFRKQYDDAQIPLTWKKRMMRDDEDDEQQVKPFGKRRKNLEEKTTRKTRSQTAVDRVGDGTSEESPTPPLRGVKEAPAPPPLTGFVLFTNEQRQNVMECSQRWRKLSSAERDAYNRRTKELKEQYRSKRNKYLRRNSVKVKSPILFAGEPKKPSPSGNTVFCREKMALLKNQNVGGGKAHLEKVSPTWRALSAEQKSVYHEKARRNIQRYRVQLQEWFSTLTVEDQAKYLEKRPTQKKYLRREGMRPRREGMRPRREGMRPRREGMRPRSEGMRPRREGMRPRMEDVHPRMEDVHPRMEDVHPRMEDVHPRMEDVHPRMEDVHPCMEDVHPRMEDVHPRMEDVHPRMEDVHPRMEDVHPRMEDVHPRMEDVHPRMEDVHPRMEDVHPRMEDVHPRMEDVHPRREDVHPRREDNGRRTKDLRNYRPSDSEDEDIVDSSSDWEVVESTDAEEEQEPNERILWTHEKVLVAVNRAEDLVGQSNTDPED